MTEHHGEIRGYDDMAAILRRVAELRNISREAIDELAGLPRGYAAKTLAEVPLRRLGPDTLGPMLGALGVKLTAHDDPEAMARYGARAADRVQKYAVNAALHGGAVHFKISLRKLRRNGRKGGANSRKFMTPLQARKLARKAARARWHKPKPIEIKGSEMAAHSVSRAPGTSPAVSPASASPPHRPTHTVDTAEL